jgi:hydrogenase nickel incorporation protein HypA/HybF
MHEFSVASALLRQVEELRQSHDCGDVRSVRVSLGEFSGVDAELLHSAFVRSTEGTRVAGAELVVERVPLEARCGDCGEEFAVRRFRFVCPVCGGHSIDVLRGEELMLESVTFEEVET